METSFFLLQKNLYSITVHSRALQVSETQSQTFHRFCWKITAASFSKGPQCCSSPDPCLQGFLTLHASPTQFFLCHKVWMGGGEDQRLWTGKKTNKTEQKHLACPRESDCLGPRQSAGSSLSCSWSGAPESVTELSCPVQLSAWSQPMHEALAPGRWGPRTVAGPQSSLSRPWKVETFPPESGLDWCPLKMGPEPVCPPQEALSLTPGWPASGRVAQLLAGHCPLFWCISRGQEAGAWGGKTGCPDLTRSSASSPTVSFLLSPCRPRWMNDGTCSNPPGPLHLHVCPS